MKTSELRTGNLISDGFFRYKIEEIKDGIVCGFSTLDGKSIYPDTLYSLNEENIEGIELTEEWLLQFGFISNRRLRQKEFTSTSIDGSVRLTLWVGTNGEGFYYLDVIQVKSVHQLQNLYFSLTGKELLS